MQRNNVINGLKKPFNINLILYIWFLFTKVLFLSMKLLEKIKTDSKMNKFIDKCITFWIYWADANPEQAVKVLCSAAFISGGFSMLAVVKLLQYLFLILN